MEPGIIGGLIGSLVGIAGGLFGTYMSVKNTNSPAERAFMVRVAIVAWVVISVFIALFLLLPDPWRHLLWLPYGLLLPVSILWVNRRQAQFREDVGAEQA